MNEETSGSNFYTSAPNLAALTMVKFLPFFQRVVMSFLVLMSLLNHHAHAADPTQTGSEEPIDYSRDIRPILSSHCFQCHGPDEGKREAGLRLDTSEGAITQLENGQAVHPGDPAQSLMVQRIQATVVEQKMPPLESGKSLSENEIKLLTRWIQQGATYNQHWSFREIVRPEEPIVDSDRDKHTAQNAIDRFILKRLADQKIEPAKEAPRSTLIRRVFLDVLGLPPKPDEVDQFLADQSATAYKAMVDRALASPHYGERWGRHWLDQARYADTHGYTIDGERSIWPYRDWVINALNADMPFDQFTIEQLAGDLLDSPSRDQLVATGFHRNTLVNQEGGTDAEQFRSEAVVDRVNTTGSVWLGLTVGCAQCHTHKYDPLTHREYYQLFAFFNQCKDVNSVAPQLILGTPEQVVQLKEADAVIAKAKSNLEALDRRRTDGTLSPEARATAAVARTKAEDQFKVLEANRIKLLTQIPETMIMADVQDLRETHVLIRGDFLRKGEVVHANTPYALPPMPLADRPRTRLDLARWLVDRRNPLTARVTVNRMWAQYFGAGLVETENDFGFQGTPPSHPELLEWLAAEFMDHNWSLKHIHRLILNSATYRQSSVYRPDIAGTDPMNKLLARQLRLRVDAEVIRDLGLAVSGLLNESIGGRSVYPPQPEGIYAFTQRSASWPVSEGPDRYRRGMYTFFMRSAPYPMLTTFDTPRFNTTCTMRVRSNTPLQSLTMANDEAMLEMAAALGRRIQQQTDLDEERIRFAFRLCFAREPRPEESTRLLTFLKDNRQQFETVTVEPGAIQQAAEDRMWTIVSRTLMNLDEFIVRE
jgi:mono/diheme cytochrome c family protein